MNALAQTHPPFTSAEFYRMAEKGAFAGFRVELRRGMILKMGPQHIPHSLVQSDLFRRLTAALKEAGLPWEVLVGVTIGFGKAAIRHAGPRCGGFVQVEAAVGLDQAIAMLTQPEVVARAT